MAKTIYVLNGPNLNLLGTREPRDLRPRDACRTWRSCAARRRKRHGLEVEFRQSNHEGELIDWIQEAGAKKAAGILINPGGYTHTSVAIRDAIAAVERAGDRGPHQQHLRARELPPPSPTSRRSPRRASSASASHGYALAIDGLAALIGAPDARAEPWPASARHKPTESPRSTTI